MVYGVPLAVLGLIQTPAGATEHIMNEWLNQGLGFCLNHIEEAFGVLIRLEGQPDEYVEFSTAALLRPAGKDRIEMLARGVQSGIYSPNEARAAEDLPAVPYGDEPRTQAQVVPLSAASGIPSAPSAPAQPAVSSSVPVAVPRTPRDDEIVGSKALNDRLVRQWRRGAEEVIS